MKNSTRISGALLLVTVAMLAASLACYSGQVPGLFELTPYYTETPLPTPESARFGIGDFALTSQETQALFNLTAYPEPLQRSLVNSKSMCLPNVTARVLYVGIGGDDNIYYLVECGGSAGWAVDQRLAGPVRFEEGDLALTVLAENQTQIQLLDKAMNFQPIVFPTCQPGTVVPIVGIDAVDVDNDGIKDLFYALDCGTGSVAYLTEANLAGPLEISPGDLALAIPEEGAETDTYRLASEPAPVTDENTVEGDCRVGSILQSQEVRRAGDTIYYRMTCGDIDGWTIQENFVGPLLFDAGDNAVIYMPSIPVFADELAALQGADQAAEEEGETAPEEETVVEEEAPIVDEQSGEPAVSEEQREVVQYTPPLYLTDNPAEPILSGDDANVVGQCVTGAIAHIEEYTGTDSVYYRITCDECVETETNDNGDTICTNAVTHEGWTSQQYLQGPVAFAAGERATLKDTGETDEDGNPVALIPAQPTYIIGSNTQFAGRCPLDDGVEVVAIRAEKDRTRNAFSFYYQIQCQGNLSTADGFDTGGQDTVIGWASERSLEIPED